MLHKQKKKAFWLKISLLLGALLFSIPLCAMWGSAEISYRQTLSFLWHKIWGAAPETGAALMESIVWQLRMPRIILGIAVGGGLSVCGVGIQSMTRNMLADPYILGVSSGASAMAALAIILGDQWGVFSSLGVSGAAFLGALLSLVSVYMISHTKENASSHRLLLAGVAVSMILNAFTQFFILSASNAQRIRSAVFWMMGSLGGARWDNVFLPLLTALGGFVIFMLLAKDMNLLSLGDESAGTLGVHVKQMRKVMLVLISLITGVMVAQSGAIGFVGLMIPHIVRFMVGANHKRVVPLSFLLGSIFLVWTDAFARTLMRPIEIPIGIITAACGGPFFIWLLRRKKKG